MELHQSSSVGETSDPKSISNPHAFSSERGDPSYVSMKSDHSISNPPTFSNKRRKPSYVSMKSDHSISNPPTFSSERGEPSCVSMKSDHSISNPPTFSSERGEPSCVSMKSDHSISNPPTFSSERGEPSCVSMKSDHSISNPPTFSSERGEPSCVSMKSDHSISNPPTFSSERGEPSCVSMKSDHSISNPPTFSSERGEPSYVSMKSDHSISNPPTFSSERGEPSYVSMKSDHSISNPPTFSSERGEPSYVSMKSDHSISNPPTFSSERGEPSYVSMKSDHSISNPPTFSSERGEPSSESVKSGAVPSEPQNPSTDETLHDSHQPANVLHSAIKRHKACMKKKYENLFEGVKTEENKTFLNKIYTQLYIIEGQSKGVNEEHEVLQMEKEIRKDVQDTLIQCSDIFKPLQASDRKTEKKKDNKWKEKRQEYKSPNEPKLRTVLTKGIAGIGKTVSVQKFILDWAEGEANQDVDFMFLLSFRELNLIKGDEYSLQGLLCDFYPELKDLHPKVFDEYKAVFIFDGLDESRIPLNFSKSKKVSDVTMKSSVGVLMTNLIKGELLPSAQIWITSRPAAANQVPSQYIYRVTEIHGFSDPQKGEYFKKRISDEDQAEKIISHIKKARSLHIMCHIPVFCWISATVLQQLMKQCDNTEIPKTLTEMYSHFLLIQTNMTNEKYKDKKKEKSDRYPKKLLESNRDILLKLAKLAFKQLIKGNLMFYEEDLRESGIDVTEASVYSGICTEIFREESVLCKRKVYCFVHLSFQEFLAAVYVFHCYERKNMEELEFLQPQYRTHSKDVPLEMLLMTAVNKAIRSENGHLDLFLRFLLGISLECNQKLLLGLLTQTQSGSKETIQRVKNVIKREKDECYSTMDRSLSIDRSINLFLCLAEMNDQSLSRELQQYLKSEKHLGKWFFPEMCSALAYMLLISEKVVDELDLRKCNTSEEGYRRLVPVVTVCRKAVLARCNISKYSCETVCSALQSENSPLKELDLSNNDLQDLGVELLSAALRSSNCKLEILRLALCNLGKEACEYLRSVLQSANSCLMELDLSSNDLQDSGVELLSAGLKSSHCKLEILRLSGCMVTDKGCSSLASALKSNPSYLRELDLSYNHPGEFGVKLLSDLLEDPHCTLIKLQLEFGGKIRMKAGLKKYACDLTLDPNTVPKRFSLSDRNRKVKNLRDAQQISHFLSVESLTGRCYWEVEWSGEWGVDIAVSYSGTGNEHISFFGRNAHSWCLEHLNNMYTVYHNERWIGVLLHPPKSGRIGVFLDWPAGTLSFYSISHDTKTWTRLHTYYTTFTEPLYAGFRVSSFLHLCDIE